MKKKITLFLLLATAVVGRAQTTTELLPVGTKAPDFQITNDKTGEKIFRLSDWKTNTARERNGRKLRFPRITTSHGFQPPISSTLREKYTSLPSRPRK